MSRIGTPAGDTLPAGVLCHGDVGSRGRWITKALDHENAKGREDTKHEGREEAGSRRREEARRHAHSGVLRKSAKGAKMVRATLSSYFRVFVLRAFASLRDFVVQRLFAISWSSAPSCLRDPALSPRLAFRRGSGSICRSVSTAQNGMQFDVRITRLRVSSEEENSP